MKNANVFVDVDLTLVDANGNLLKGAREGLNRLKDKGCHLFLWSTCGAEYCRKVAALHRLTELFEGFTAKPDIGTSWLMICPPRASARLFTTCSRKNLGQNWQHGSSKSTLIELSML